MTTREQSAINLAPGQGDSLWILGQLMTFKVRRQNDNCSIFELVSAPGTGAPPHRHQTQDETHYVLRGEYEFLLEDQTVRVGPGSTVYVPRGTVHGFTSVGSTSGTLLFIETPAGPLEEFMEAVGDPVEDTSQPPNEVPDMEQILIAAEQTGGIQFVTPGEAGY